MIAPDPAALASLATARLRLRRFTVEDVRFALELHQNRNLVRFIPTAALDTLGDARDWIRRVEAARALLVHGFGGGLSRIIAVVDPANAPSRRVCERLQMRHLGRTDAYYDREVELYEATAPEVTPSRARPRPRR
jgi:hypothetical protein